MLHGDLAAILTFASGKKNPVFSRRRSFWEKELLEGLLGRMIEGQNAKKPFFPKGLVQMLGFLVAGAGFEPAAFRL